MLVYFILKTQAEFNRLYLLWIIEGESMTQVTCLPFE